MGEGKKTKNTFIVNEKRHLLVLLRYLTPLAETCSILKHPNITCEKYSSADPTMENAPNKSMKQVFLSSIKNYSLRASQN